MAREGNSDNMTHNKEPLETPPNHGGFWRKSITGGKQQDQGSGWEGLGVWLEGSIRDSLYLETSMIAFTYSCWSGHDLPLHLRIIYFPWWELEGPFRAPSLSFHRQKQSPEKGSDLPRVTPLCNAEGPSILTAAPAFVSWWWAFCD